MKKILFSHGEIAMLDSFLRKALHGQQDKFPLSAALFASAKLKTRNEVPLQLTLIPTISSTRYYERKNAL